jgi:hypothetical protein
MFREHGWKFLVLALIFMTVARGDSLARQAREARRRTQAWTRMGRVMVSFLCERSTRR